MNKLVQRHGETISLPIRQQVSVRYKTVTRAINQNFWNSDSDTDHSLYVGSYGRNTAINTSDIDILVELPEPFFIQLNRREGNIQSSLLQSIRKTLREKYPKSDIHADGQVVQISFSDGIEFEIVPAFKQENGKYKYPDTNQGGKWRSTNPKAEQQTMQRKNKISNGLLFDTCKHIRYIRDNFFASDYLSGIVIDSFVFSAINFWEWLPPGVPSEFPAGTYEKQLLEKFEYHSNTFSQSIAAPGSCDPVPTEKSFDCLRKVLKFIAS